ncbi:MAG: hypothetical protein KAS32_28270 [Candidatus Peribacteraceae bacterium]|nr:hypothetical protein [Candidatus Peribacteraceae bacterium]
MNRLIIILMLMATVVHGAGTEVHDPDATIRLEVNWSCPACPTSISDDDLETFAQKYDNDYTGVGIYFTCDDTAISDSTIDSVTVFLQYEVTNVACTFQLQDSVAGQTYSGWRNTSTITAPVSGSDLDTSITYTSPPDGGAYTWTDIDNMCIGVFNVAMINNKALYVDELWFTVFYHYAGAPPPTNPQVIMITGGD